MTPLPPLAHLRAEPRDLGDGMVVRRALPRPYRVGDETRRAVGPFVFWDHMGPAELPPGHGVDVRPHPHIGLATITYLFSGEIFHRDSLGSSLAIRPGAVNWMIAGRGIVHSERTSPETLAAGQRLHGIQAWVALPDADEACEPAFHHVPEDALPAGAVGGAAVRVLVGAVYGLRSPVPFGAPIFYAHAALPAGATLPAPDSPEERAFYVARGAVSYAGAPYGEGSLVVLAAGEAAPIVATAEADVLVFGGASVGPRVLTWNFVARDAATIARAAEDWKSGKFPKVPGDETDYIPYPA